MSDCLFCSIVAGDIPADVVHETETVLAFRDIAPQARVHVLMIPKAHHGTLAQMTGGDEQGVSDLFAAAGAVALAEGVAESGYRLLSNVGADAGQEVAHVHVHLLGGQQLGALVTPPG